MTLKASELEHPLFTKTKGIDHEKQAIGKWNDVLGMQD